MDVVLFYRPRIPREKEKGGKAATKRGDAKNIFALNWCNLTFQDNKEQKEKKKKMSSRLTYGISSLT